jgi:hypothetical protein
LSGAVGGATGAGLSAALNGKDVLGSAIQGAQQGFGQGALAGGVLTGAGMTKNSIKNAINGGQAPQTDVYNRLSQQNEPEIKETETIQPRENNTDNFLAYGDSELANRTKRGMVADGLERLGNTFEGAQANVTRAAAKDLGIESTGKVIENVRKKTGLTNLETQSSFAKELTGGKKSLMDTIQKKVMSIREDGQPYKVDTTPVTEKIQDIVDKYADSNMFGSAKAKDQFIYNIKKDISNANADVIEIANRMKATASDLRGKGVGEIPAKDKAQSKIYTEVANELDNLSYSAIPQENVDALFDATINEMRGRANQAAAAGNRAIEKAYNTAADTLDAEPRTIKAYRSFKKDFVDVSKVDYLTGLAENGAAAQMGRSFGGGVRRLFNTVAQRPINTALAKAGGIVNSVADRLNANGGDVAQKVETPISTNRATTNNANIIDTSYNPSTKMYEAIGRTEGLNNGEQARTANYLAEAVQNVNQNQTANNTLESLATPTNNMSSNSVYTTMYGQPSTAMSGTAADSYFQPTGDYWTDILGIAMTNSIKDGDYNTFGALYSMYQDASSKLEKSKGKDYSDITNWNSADRTKLLSAQNAMGQIDQLESAYNQATGGSGGNVLQGNLRSLAANISGGNLDPSANNYNKLAESVGMGIVKNLINLGVTEADAKRYLEYLPALTDTKEQAQQKLETLRNIYQNQMNNLYSAYSI